MNRIICSLVVFIFLPGCSWLGIEDSSSDYLNSNEVQPTVVPENLDSDRLGQIYPIPKLAQKLVPDTSSEIPRPQPISVNAFEQLVKIQKIENKRWILVNSSPSKLWPRIRNILNSSGLQQLLLMPQRVLLKLTGCLINQMKPISIALNL